MGVHRMIGWGSWWQVDSPWLQHSSGVSNSMADAVLLAVSL